MYIFSGNHRQHRVAKSTPAEVQIKLDGVTISSELVTPVGGVVVVNVGDIAGAAISYALPRSTTKRAISIASVVIDGVAYEFKVVRGGVDSDSIDAKAFLLYNFLTWQNTEVRSHIAAPRYLRYVATCDCTIKAKIYHQGGIEIVSVINATAGEDVWLNLSHAHFDFVPSNIDKNQIGALDLFVESAGIVCSYVQRYVFHNDKNPLCNTYVYQNSLGGFDTIELIGDLVTSRSSESTEFTNYDKTAILATDTNTVYKKSSGYLRVGDIAVFNEFLASPQKYELTVFGLREIILSDKTTVETKLCELPSGTFDYKFTKESGYLNIERTELPSELTFEFNGELFSLAPRLSLYRHADMVRELLFPIQGADSKAWMYATIGEIYDAIPLAGYDVKGLASFDSKYFTSADGFISIIEEHVGFNLEKLEKYLTEHNYLRGDDLGNDFVANSAKKLQTKRMIYGQWFDGTADVDGDLTTSGGVLMFSTGGGSGSGGGGGIGGTENHAFLTNREQPDQHPVAAISNLQSLLDSKAPSSHTHTIYALLNGSATEDFKTKTLTASGVSYFKSGLVMFGTEGGTGGGGTAGTYYHDQLENRNLPAQHTIAAITDLQAMLDSKVQSNDVRLTNARSASDVYSWAKAALKPTYSWNELLEKGDLVTYIGEVPSGSNNHNYWAKGGWNENIDGATTSYYNLYSGGSASSILLKHEYFSNTIFYRKSIDTNRWLSDWNYFWTSSNIMFSSNPIPNDGVKYDKDGYVNAIIFRDTYRTEDMNISSIYVRASDTFLRNTSVSNFKSKLGLWHTQNLNRPITTYDERDMHNMSGTENKIWFDYNFAGTGLAGSAISFSGLSAGYTVQIFGTYQYPSLHFRTRHGDLGTWNQVREIYHTGNANLLNVNWDCARLRASGTVVMFSV